MTAWWPVRKQALPPPDLVRESEHRAACAAWAAEWAHEDEDDSATAGWPDPHGPDPVVFGAFPRVGN